MKGDTLLEIGLTGGMGSGKSTVGEMLTGRGAVLVDADAIVRELQAPGTLVFEAMVTRWGAGIVDNDGSLDRAEVAARVFVDAAELAASTRSSTRRSGKKYSGAARLWQKPIPR